MTSFTQRLSSWDNPPWWYALVALPWLVGLALMAIDAHGDSKIASRERTAQGTVTAHDPANHDSYEYRYTVDGRSYSAWQMPYRVDWHVGQQVVVYYDPTNPGVSSLVEFAQLSEDARAPIPMAMLGIGGVLGFICYRRLRAGRIMS